MEERIENYVLAAKLCNATGLKLMGPTAVLKLRAQKFIKHKPPVAASQLILRHIPYKFNLITCGCPSRYVQSRTRKILVISKMQVKGYALQAGRLCVPFPVAVCDFSLT
jgi:hypothetical protein